MRDQQVRNEGDNRHDAELHALIERKRSAPHVHGHEFGHIGVNGDQFHANADACDQAPQADAEAGGLESHDQRRRTIEQHGVGEDRPPAVFIGY